MQKPKKKLALILEKILIKKKLTKKTSLNHEDQTNIDQDRWFIVGESVIGKSHINNSLPCQDNYFNKVLPNDWGIAIVSDGAGSAGNSHIGSAFIAKEAIPRFFEELIISKGWYKASSLPSQDEWKAEARKGMLYANGCLRHLADDKNLTFSSLACTAIVVIYSPLGILVTHVGDGRAGSCNELGDWTSIMTPHKGEEANQTIFVTSSNWVLDETYIMSGVEVPESRVIVGKPEGFTLLSDGCEYHSFECSVMDTDGQWKDPNLPHSKFFNPIISTLKDAAKSKGPFVDINQSWKNFLQEGTDGLKNEADDKTMIIGIPV